MRAATLRPVLVLGAWVLSLALVAVPGRAGDTYWDLYSQGKEAVDAGRFSQGRDLLDRARSARAAEGNHRIGMQQFEYYPSHYLALACLELGDLGQAEAHLKVAEAVKPRSSAEDALVRELRNRFERAARERAAPAPAPSPAPPPVAQPAAPSAAARLARTAFDRNDIVEARRFAEQALAADPGDAVARRVLDDVKAYVDVKVAAARDDLAAGALDAAEARLQDALRISPNQSEAKDLLATLGSRRDSARAATAAVAKPSARETAAAPPPRVPSPTVAAPVAATPAAKLPAANPASAAELRAGVEAYFQGRLGESIDLLGKALAGGRGAQPEVLAILASAHASRGLVEDGRAATADLGRARAIFQDALELRADLQLDRRYFSPRVVALLDEVRAAQGP